MKKKSRDINIFSMSALDLFASALGAFILLTVVFMPFFPNTGESPRISEALKEKLDQCSQDLADANNQLSQCQATLKEYEKRPESCNICPLPKQATALFGITTKADKVAILIDMSGSIDPYKDMVVSTVKDIVGGLPQGTEVFLRGIHQGNYRYPASNYTTLNMGSPSVFVSQTKKMMKNIGGSTPTTETVKIALQDAPQAIIVITDGEPDLAWQVAVQNITQANNLRAEIHAVAIGQAYKDSEFIKFLASLTKKNNGNLVAALPDIH